MAVQKTNVEALNQTLSTINSTYDALLKQVMRIDSSIKELQENGGFADSDSNGAATEFQKTSEEFLNVMNASRDRMNKKFEEVLQYWIETISSAENDLKSEVSNID